MGMDVLVACEESQAVCIEFRKKGHNAFSCDLYECSGGRPEWHIKGDVLKILNGNCSFTTQDGKRHSITKTWDMILAFPPCTHLAVSGARHFKQKRADGRQRDAIKFFGKILNADCNKIVVENPVNIISGKYINEYFPELSKYYGFPIKPTQIIQPWNFGDNYSKSTCLWIKGLPPLIPEILDKPDIEYVDWIDKKTGVKKRQDKWSYNAFCMAKTSQQRQMIRSKTFPGIARAMANRWG